MKGIVQAVKRRMHKDDRQDSNKGTSYSMTGSNTNFTAGKTSSPSGSRSAATSSSAYDTPTSSSSSPSSATATSTFTPSATSTLPTAVANPGGSAPTTSTASRTQGATTGSGTSNNSPLQLNIGGSSANWRAVPPISPRSLAGASLASQSPTAGGLPSNQIPPKAPSNSPRSLNTSAPTSRPSSPPRAGVRTSPGSTPFARSRLSGSPPDGSVPGLDSALAVGGGSGLSGSGDLDAALTSPCTNPSTSGRLYSSSGELGSGAGGDSGFFAKGEGVYYPRHVQFDGNPFAELPALRDTAVARRLDLLKKKLRVCSIVFNFNMSHAFQFEKEMKRATLCELVEYINNTRVSFNEHVMEDVIRMVSANIFRSLPPTSAGANGMEAAYDTEGDDYALDSAWPHLQVVYEFFLRVVVSHDTDPKVAKRYIEQNFILKLLELFDSEDPRERDYLKTILHRIYGKIMAMRSFIRKAIQQLFFRSVYEKELDHGIAELLEILGSIVNGFALPLKEEHKVFLEKSLIPLHKGRNLLSYHPYLAYCMAQYVDKDNRLAESIILGLLKFWPATNTSKEVLFLNEVDEILELTQMAEFQKIMWPLFKRLSLCIQSPHFQVAERVLFFWNSDHIVKLINHNRHRIFPIVIRALYKNSKEHWNTTVNGLTYNVSKLLAQADPQLFDDCSNECVLEEEETGEVDVRHQHVNRCWQELQMAYDMKVATKD